MDLSLWYGVFAPAGTPQPIVELLGHELVAIVGAPELAQRFVSLGLEPAPAGRALRPPKAHRGFRTLAPDRAAGRIQARLMGVFAAVSGAARLRDPRALPVSVAARHDFLHGRLSVHGGVRHRGLHAAMEHAMRAPPDDGCGTRTRRQRSPARRWLPPMARRASRAAQKVIVFPGSQQGFDLILRVTSNPAIPCSSSGRPTPPRSGVAPRREGLSPVPTARAWSRDWSRACKPADQGDLYAAHVRQPHRRDNVSPGESACSSSRAPSIFGHRGRCVRRPAVRRRKCAIAALTRRRSFIWATLSKIVAPGLRVE